MKTVNQFVSNPTTPSKRGASKSQQRDAFQDFEEKTIDAWDDGDDDIVEMSSFKMSLKDVHSTAMQVLQNHSKGCQSQRTNGEIADSGGNAKSYQSTDVIIKGRVSEPSSVSEENDSQQAHSSSSVSGEY